MTRWHAFRRTLRLRAAAALSARPPHAMLVWAALAGLVGALATVAFRELLHLVQWLATGHDEGLVKTAAALPTWQRVAVPTAGGLLAGLALVWALKLSRRQPAPDYMEAVSIGDGVLPVAPSLARSLSCALSVGTGASIGREGPMVQLAAVAASCIGRWTRLDESRRRLLVACGASAGIAAAYNAPIAGALFVSEIVLGSIAMTSLGPLIVASAAASITTHRLLGYRATYDMPAIAALAAADWLPIVLLGIAAGLVAPVFLGLLDAARALWSRSALPLPLRLGTGGLVVGLLSVAVPQVWGNGYSVVNAILGGTWPAGALALVLGCKLVATLATVGSGAVGGVFTPTLFVGAALGALLAHGLDALQPGSADAGMLAAVGMGTLLAATTQAPLMSIVMIAEMTASEQLVLPLMLACVLAYSVARLFREDSVYTPSLRRQSAERPRRALGDYRVRELVKQEASTLAPGTPVEDVARAFAQRRVQYLYVVDAAQRYVGAVSLHELNTRRGDATAREARDLLVELGRLRPEMTIAEALLAFASHHGERLPVVDPQADGRLLGSVRKTDLLFLLNDSIADAR